MHQQPHGLIYFMFNMDLLSRGLKKAGFSQDARATESHGSEPREVAVYVEISRQHVA